MMNGIAIYKDGLLEKEYETENFITIALEDDIIKVSLY